MGRAEAQRDSVRFERGEHGTEFFPRCFFCLQEIRSRHYVAERRYVCPACKPLIKTFKAYYADKASRTLFEAIDKELRTQAHPPGV